MLWRGFAIFKTLKSFDQITTLTYVLMYNFLSLFNIYFRLRFGLINSVNTCLRLKVRQTKSESNLYFHNRNL